MTKRTKVLHIITNLPIGGAQDNTLITVERLDRKKYDITLMCAPEGRWVRRALDIPNLNLFFIDKLVRPINLFRDLTALWKIYRFIKKGKYTIVHTHSSKPGFIGRIAAWLAGVPIIIHTIHGFPFNDFMRPAIRRFYIELERILARATHKLVTVSKLNLEKAVQLKLAAPHKFINVYSGIDFEKYDVAINITQKRKEIGIANGEKVIGTAGRLSEQKAPWNFIQAIPIVTRYHDNTRFVMMGDGELMEKMKKLAATLKVSHKIIFLGFRDDVAEILKTFDIFVLTSQWEGLGRSLTEAMYLGRPVIATSVEGVPELVQHNKTGILVPTNDPKAIADEIGNLLSNSAKCERVGRAAKKKINTAFEANRMVNDIDNIYQNILHHKNLIYSTNAPKKSNGHIPQAPHSKLPPFSSKRLSEKTKEFSLKVESEV